MFFSHGSFSARKSFTKLQVSSEGKRGCFRSKNYSRGVLCHKIQELEFSSCLVVDSIVYSTKIRGRKTFRLFKSIVNNSERDTLQSVPIEFIKSLVHVALIYVHTYVVHIKVRPSFWDKFKRNPFVVAVKYFHILMYKLLPEMSELVVTDIIDFFKTERLWSIEFICYEILMSLLQCNTPPANILSITLQYLKDQLSANNLKEARHVIQVLYKILCDPFWGKQKAMHCKYLIELYYSSICEMDGTNPFYQMRRGFEFCLLRMCEIVPNLELIIIIDTMFELCFGGNLPAEAIIDFSHTIETAIMYADFETISQVMNPKILEYTLKAVISDNQRISKIGCRLMARLFDRHRNYAEFITPRIFLPNKYYKIRSALYRTEDMEFFKRYRHDIEFHILSALQKHQKVCILEPMFTVLCTMLVETTSGYTTCQVISILLQLQDFALTLNGNTVSKETNQMHAMVLSVMTFIAWLHRASSLSLYVERILNRRADYAPHLNPPIKLVYQYAQHHVLWNEPSLFFDFWEIRYGMWKRFRSNEMQLPIQSEKLMITSYGKPELRESKRDRIKEEIIASNLVRESVGSFF